ncbi:DUF3616 domain-containing protein [Pseudonocardia kujensis]|uniref:DUF3616 domain-containing protein n=1 Tax=Pseudonocardia kujensis TaxID=1128675 RepID=UPI001E2AC1E6|nr:DUF3616 domain-containing protein [Pseudonocardia kujensis]MCE0765199.1 DUF3616 domain-containing protein [Pseudonocardia kujensis]
MDAGLLRLERQVELRFAGDTVRTGNHVNLSAVQVEGSTLWLAGDETATIERLELDHGLAVADKPVTFPLAELVRLPGPPDQEADIEGLARSGGFLWAIGSHSLKRRRVRPHDDAAKTLKRLSKVRREENRYVLARLAVEAYTEGPPELRLRTAAGVCSALVGAPGSTGLTDLLADDPRLGPFLAIPGKDNGFDVEGLAVHGESVYVGLRGPVLRGWAVVLELLPQPDPADDGRLVLGAFPGGERYRTHVLDLGGLGVRDLCPHGDDLLVLAGPSMALSGPVRLYRWRDAAASDRSGPVRRDRLPLLGELPHGQGEDHAEGIALLPGTGPARLLVVHDSPGPDRRPTASSVLADIVALDG